MIRVHRERQFAFLQRLADEQRHRAFGGLVFVAFVFKLFDAVKNRLQLRRVVRELEAQFLRLDDDVAAPGEIADENVSFVADERRIHVLVAGCEFLHSVDVRAALVRKRGRAHPRQARIVAQVGNLVHERRKFFQLRQRLRRHGSFFQLQCDAGDDTGQIAVAGAFAVTVDRALHMACAHFERGERVRDAQADVVVRVDANLAIQLAGSGFGDGRDFARQTAAVRVAEHHEIRAGLFRRAPGVQRVFGIELVTVERVFRVVDDKLAVVFQELHRVADHGQILFRRAAQHFLHVQHGRLAVDGDDGRFRFDEQAHLVVRFHRHAFFARRAERREAGVLEFLLLGLRKELDVLGIAARPAAFDVMNSKRVQLLGDAELVRHRKVDAFALRTVAQSRVVDFDLGFHINGRKNGGLLSLNPATVANRKSGRIAPLRFPGAALDCRHGRIHRHPVPVLWPDV